MTKTRAVCACLGQSLVGSFGTQGILPTLRLVLPEMTARKTRSTRAQKKTDTGSGLLSPPSSNGDKTGDRDVAGPSSTMISPPPEEDGGRRSKGRVSYSALT
jgi:hypothetical protein